MSKLLKLLISLGYDDCEPLRDLEQAMQVELNNNCPAMAHDLVEEYCQVHGLKYVFRIKLDTYLYNNAVEVIVPKPVSKTRLRLHL